MLFFTKGINLDEVERNAEYCRECFKEGVLTKVDYNHLNNPVCGRKEEHNTTHYYSTDGELDLEELELERDDVITGSEILERYDSSSELH